MSSSPTTTKPAPTPARILGRAKRRSRLAPIQRSPATHTRQDVGFIPDPFAERAADCLRESRLPWKLGQRAAAAALMFALAPLFLVSWILIRSSSRGPFLFVQIRRGLLGKPFRIFKMRTVSVDVKQKTKLGLSADDPSITPVGRILRFLKIDELPQLWNVVRGDMEIVGPRPIPLPLERSIVAVNPAFRARYAARPGVTYPSQLQAEDDATDMRLVRDWQQRFRLEVDYIERKSFRSDLGVIAATIALLFQRASQVLREMIMTMLKRPGSESIEQDAPDSTLEAKPSSHEAQIECQTPRPLILALRAPFDDDVSRECWERGLAEASKDADVVLLSTEEPSASEAKLCFECLGLPEESRRGWLGRRNRDHKRYIAKVAELYASAGVLCDDNSAELARAALKRRGGPVITLSEFAEEGLTSLEASSVNPGQHPTKNRPLRVAFMGTRGVPASYSGFETFVEELGVRMAADGVDVTVYNRKGHFEEQTPESYRGMKVVTLPSIKSKHFETIVHSSLSLFHSMGRGYDVVVFCGVGNAPLFFLPRLFGKRVICNVDGSDWKRGKWGGFASVYLKTCEKIAAASADLLISDSVAIQRDYLSRWNVPSRYLAYGGGLEPTESSQTLEEFGLEKGRYILQVGRTVPENNAHLLIEAFEKIEDPGMKLVIVGDASYSEDYKTQLRELAGENVVFTGYQFAEAYRELSSHAYAFVMACWVGGSHPVLLEQMSIGNCCVVYGMPSNREVIGDAGMTFDPEQGADDLAAVLELLIDDPEETSRIGEAARARADRLYSWPSIAGRYKGLITSLFASRSR